MASSTSRDLASIRDQALDEHFSSAATNSRFQIKWVRDPVDGSILHDQHGRPISVDRILGTKPLRHEICTRPGPGGKTLTYMGGDAVARTLNEVFGYDGWNLQVISVEMNHCELIQGKWTVAYTSHVRISVDTTFREELGQGDSTDRSKAAAASNAMKASVTDAIKRAARLFGDKLGNTLYGISFSKKDAPLTLAEALDLYDKERTERLRLCNVDPTTHNKEDHFNHATVVKHELHALHAHPTTMTCKSTLHLPVSSVLENAAQEAPPSNHSKVHTNSPPPLRTSSTTINQNNPILNKTPGSFNTHTEKRPYSDGESWQGSSHKKHAGHGINPYAYKPN